MEKDQRIRDPVHDLIKFSHTDQYDKVLWQIAQSAPMQRLRRIKQLGFSEFVYPGATHTRLSHSFGALQMARRMFEIFERNEVFQRDKKDHPHMRAATLAAVLLHDIGHGPYSHVFEELSAHAKVNVPHEEYTRLIIKDTQIGRILKEHGLFDDVIAFFEKDVPNNPYTAIVSSQLDADRLDFLTRDRYFTGIQVGQIDREWLFDSLRIAQVSYGVEEGETRHTFVVVQKGLGVLEDYISAYLKLYESVYLHKTTRGIQFLVELALTNALSNMAAVRDSGLNSPLLEYFFLKPEERLAHYLCLDDVDVVTVLKQLAVRDLGEASDFASRFLEREALKCYEPNDPNKPMDRNRSNAFRALLKDKGIWFHLDVTKEKGFKHYGALDEDFLRNIMVKVDDKQIRPIGEVAPDIPTSLRARCRFYFRTRADREAAQKAWHDM